LISRDGEAVVGRGLVAHPGDDRGPGAPLTDRDALGARHGAAAHRRGACAVTRAASLAPRARSSAGEACRNAVDLGAELDDVMKLRFRDRVAPSRSARVFFRVRRRRSLDVEKAYARGLMFTAGALVRPFEALRPRFSEHG
jgi:hypothetical protein